MNKHVSNENELIKSVQTYHKIQEVLGSSKIKIEAVKLGSFTFLEVNLLDE